jgi:hypothetical protein
VTNVEKVETQSRGTLNVSDSKFLSPLKNRKGGYNISNSKSDNSEKDHISTVSSNISSFYLDKIEELIPEKKSVAEKLIRSKTSIF